MKWNIIDKIQWMINNLIIIVNGINHNTLYNITKSFTQ